MAAEPFVWGQGSSKESIERRRKVAEAMMLRGSDSSPVQHWTQGLARVAEAIAGRVETSRLDSEAKGAQSALAGDASLLAGGGGGAIPAAAPSMAGDGSSRTMAMPNVSPEMKDGIVQTASALGISPVDLATTISYETAGTFDPTKAGPTTKWGQHRGLIQFGEPQARQHGVDWTNPVASQLGPNGAVASYLRTAGVKPGMGLMDIYSAINAGGVGLYDRSDTAAGGAPGTVADKVNNQMAGHRAKAMRLFADLPAPGARPVQAETGAEGFFIPPSDGGLPIMQPGGALPNFDQDTGRWKGPSATPPLAAAPEPAPTADAPAAPDQSLAPVFMAEGTSQPWMGSAVMPAPPEPRAIAAAPVPLPPARPADLAMPQADLPAAGAVPAMGQVTPQLPAQVPPDLSNENDAGSRFTAGGGVNAPIGDNATIFDRIAAAMGSRPAPAAAAPSAAVARVAQAMPAATGASAPATPSAGVERVAAAMPQANGQLAAAMRILNSPYAQPGQSAVAQAVVERSLKGAEFESMTRPDGSVWRVPKSGGGAPVQVFGPQSKPAEPGSQVQVFRDEKTGEIVSVDKSQVGTGAQVVRPGQPRPDTNMDPETKLRTEFSGRLKDFTTVQDAYGRIVASVENRATNPNDKSPASDIALVFGYMKMLDPGSVVREGEYATAQNAAGIPERIRNAYNKAVDGEFLDPKQRGDMLSTAQRLYKRARSSAEAEGKRYRELATSYGLNADRVVAMPGMIEMPQIGGPAPATATPPAAAPGAPAPMAAPKSKAEYDALPSGTPYMAPDGQPRVKP